VEFCGIDIDVHSKLLCDLIVCTIKNDIWSDVNNHRPRRGNYDLTNDF